MHSPLRVLMLEDVASDASLVRHELRKLGDGVIARQVQTQQEFVEALQEFAPSIILADYSLPSFNGLSALAISRERVPETPFIFVSGAIGEEQAILALKSGATDYVLKDRLERLVPAVERALREAEERDKRHAAEEALRQAHAVLEQRVRERTAELDEANRALQEYAADLQAANRRLQEQAEELEVQAEELRLQNEELASVTSELEAQRSNLEAVVQQMPAGVVIADAPSGRLLLANQQLARMVRQPFRTADRIEEYTVFQGYHPDGKPYQPEEWPLARSIRTGEVVVGEEVDYLHPDGTLGTMSVSSAPIMNGMGRIVAGVASITDITERKEMERSLREAMEALQAAQADLERRVQERTAELTAANQALQQSEALLRKVLDTLPVGVFIANRHGKIVSGNPAGRRIWAGIRYVGPEGYGEYQGTWADSGKPIEPDEWALSRAVNKGETSIGEEIEINRFDGTSKTILNSAAPLFDADGKIFAAIVVNEDITERKRAERELARYAMRLEVLREIDRAVLSQRSAADIAAVTARDTRRLVPCDRAVVLLFDYERGEAERLAVSTDTETTLKSGTRMPLEVYRGFGGSEHNGTILVDDILSVSELTAMGKMLAQEGMRSYVSAPLVVEGRLIGNLNLASSKARAFPAESLDTVAQVADSLAVAIQNAMLNQQVHQDRLRLQDLSRRLVQVQENERRVIAQELHDEAGQSLTSLIVGLGLLERDVECSEPVLKRIWQLKHMTEEVMEGLHRLAVNLRPASLDRVGLIPTLRQYTEAFGQQNNLDVQFEVLGLDERRLPTEVETALYRVVQEALTNIARHAQASHVGIILERRDNSLIAIIEDDGKGFNPDQVTRRDRLGLFGMRERAEMMGGTLTIESAPGSGTTVFVEVPSEPYWAHEGRIDDRANSDR